MPENDVAARALYDLATARAGEFIDGLRDLVGEMIAARLAAFDLDAVETDYQRLCPVIEGALKLAGQSEREVPTLLYRLWAQVAFAVEDYFATDAVSRAAALYRAAAGGGDFEAAATLLILSALRRVDVHERARVARALSNDLIVGRLAARGGESGSVDQLWRQARGIERAAMAAAGEGESQDAKRSRGAGQLHQRV